MKKRDTILSGMTVAGSMAILLVASSVASSKDSSFSDREVHIVGRCILDGGDPVEIEGTTLALLVSSKNDPSVIVATTGKEKPIDITPGALCTWKAEMP